METIKLEPAPEIDEDYENDLTENINDFETFEECLIKQEDDPLDVTNLDFHEIPKLRLKTENVEINYNEQSADSPGDFSGDSDDYIPLKKFIKSDRRSKRRVSKRKKGSSSSKSLKQLKLKLKSKKRKRSKSSPLVQPKRELAELAEAIKNKALTASGVSGRRKKILIFALITLLCVQKRSLW